MVMLLRVLGRLGLYLDLFVRDSAVAVDVRHVVRPLTSGARPYDIFLADGADGSRRKVLAACPARYFVAHCLVFSNYYNVSCNSFTQL